MENFDSQDKTYSMIEKMTFSATEKRDGKKLMFQSSRCGLSPGSGKRIMCRRTYLSKENCLCYFLECHVSLSYTQDTQTYILNNQYKPEYKFSS